MDGGFGVCPTPIPVDCADGVQQPIHGWKRGSTCGPALVCAETEPALSIAAIAALRAMSSAPPRLVKVMTSSSETEEKSGGETDTGQIDRREIPKVGAERTTCPLVSYLSIETDVRR
jgi:hypothetical protein